MQSFLAVFIGGGLGSICRYGISRMLQSYQYDFPLATFLANAISCIVLGVLMSWTLKYAVPTPLKLLWLTGFCGGFSTFSTFSLETFLLLQTGNYAYAFSNIFLSLVICLICIWIGMSLIS